jgi:ankyrin repeat protein
MASDEVKKVRNLCHAIQRRNNWEEVELLLNFFSGQVPNVYLSERKTVLHIAVESDPPAYILRQILRMVDIDFCSQPNDSGATPLSLICEYGRDMDSIRLLALERPQDFFGPTTRYHGNGSSPCDELMRRQTHFFLGLDEVGIAQIIADVVEVWPDGVLHVDNDGRTLLQRAIPFSDAKHDFTLLRTILAIHPQSIEMTDWRGASAIHVALGWLDDEDGFERLELLLECGGSNAICDSNGQTPLHKACESGYPRDVIMILVANHPSALNVRDKHGMTPLDTFRQHNQYFLTKSDYGNPTVQHMFTYLVDTAMTLLTKAPVRCSDSLSLHDLLHNEDCTSDIAKLLIYALRDQTSLKDDNGNLPLHIVASMDCDNDIMYGKVIELLLEVYPAACQISNSEGSLPLHIVASRDSNDNIMYGKVIEALLEVYPAACQISNSEGTLLLQLMDRSGKSWSNGMRRVLLQHPAAVLDLELNHVARCSLLAKVGSEEQPDALFRLLKDAPVFAPRAT